MSRNKILNKVTFVFLYITGIFAFLQVGNTYAYLNDGETVKDNSFGTGTLQIELRKVNSDDADSVISPSNSITKYFEVENIGNEEFIYSLELKDTPSDNDLCGEVDLKAYLVPDTGEAILKYDGKLKNFAVNSDGTDNDLLMSLGDVIHNFTFEYSLPNDADSALSLSSCEFDVIAKAWMPEFSYQNAHWDDSTVTDELDSGNWLIEMGFETAETLKDEDDGNPDLGFCAVVTNDKSAEDNTAATQEIKWNKVENTQKYVINKFVFDDPNWDFVNSTEVLLTNPNLTESGDIMTYVTSVDAEGLYGYYIQAFNSDEELIGATTPKETSFTCTFEVVWFEGGDVVINEVMWAGSHEHEKDEWIELRNTTDEEIDLKDWIIEGAGPDSHEMKLTGKIPANGYYLVSHYPTDYDVGNEKAAVNNSIEEDEYRRTGSESMHLEENGEKLILRDPVGNKIDETPDVENGPDKGWAAGEAGNYGHDDTSWRSMQRIELDDSDPGDGNNPDNWYTCNHDECNDDEYWDDNDGRDYGTPKHRNLANQKQILVLEFLLNNTLPEISLDLDETTVGVGSTAPVEVSVEIVEQESETSEVPETASPPDIPQVIIPEETEEEIPAEEESPTEENTTPEVEPSTPEEAEEEVTVQ
ncbi:lamin tail domain-containing protein [candidate division WWE3 bacterium]|uniref:Lamin tail domain-containing protein n=1 Tax=candidate division WWE3 bacterium TaxID=2053526 RepID=A0A7X9HH16_UNCKA|nr:lamin tail domain-containing protein [candidate division WWE3 bacterium]